LCLDRLTLLIPKLFCSKKEEEWNRIRMNALYQFKLGWMATSA
jgi:hypothetical protein